MGTLNKLLIGVDGMPMVRHAIAAVRGAGIETIIVVTGHQQAEVTAALADLPVAIVHNPAYAEGLSASLKAGLAALPAGIDGVLVSDVGLLWALGRAKRAGRLPADFVLKTSLALPTMNPASARVYVELGATSLNLATDLPVADIAGIREAVDVPLDCYIEGADDFAAPLRYHEIEEIVEVAAPVHLKFGLRNVAGVYPAGGHIAATVVSASRERVRRAAIGLETLRRRAPELYGP